MKRYACCQHFHLCKLKLPACTAVTSPSSAWATGQHRSLGAPTHPTTHVRSSKACNHLLSKPWAQTMGLSLKIPILYPGSTKYKSGAMLQTATEQGRVPALSGTIEPTDQTLCTSDRRRRNGLGKRSCQSSQSQGFPIGCPYQGLLRAHLTCPGQHPVRCCTERLARLAAL